jgi:hypothetical protein
MVETQFFGKDMTIDNIGDGNSNGGGERGYYPEHGVHQSLFISLNDENSLVSGKLVRLIARNVN